MQDTKHGENDGGHMNTKKEKEKEANISKEQEGRRKFWMRKFNNEYVESGCQAQTKGKKILEWQKWY